MGQGKHTAVREFQSLAVWEKKLLSLTSLQTFKNCNSKTMQCIQGFPKDVKGRGIPLVEDRMGDFAGRFGGGGGAVIKWWKSDEPFSKAKNKIL